MAKQRKLPSISKARQAIFDKYQINLEQAQAWHADLERDFDKIKTSFTGPAAEIRRLTNKPILQFTDDHELDGNMILEDILGSRKKSNEGIIRRAQAFHENSARFFKIFKIQLRKYWPNNVMGFDLFRFDTEVVKHGDNESIKEVIAKKWGKEAADLIQSLCV